MLRNRVVLWAWVMIISTSASSAQETMLAYQIAHREVMTTAGGLNALNQVIVATDSIPSEQSLRAVSEAIWRDKNVMWGEFTVFIFLKDMNLEGSSYAIARFTPAGIQNFSLQQFSLKGTRYLDLTPVVVASKAIDTLQKQQAIEYDVSLVAKKPSPHRILVTGSTNLPDNTLVSINISRPYLRQGSDQEYLGHISKKVVAVKGGMFELNDTVVDYRWYTALVERKKVDTNNEFTGFRSISPRVKVVATISTADQTVSAVVARLGALGEKMNGPLVVKGPKSAVLEQSAITEIEFQK